MCAQKTMVSSKTVMIANIYQRNFIENRKKNGKCISCGGDLDRDGVHCTKCREKINEGVKLTRHYYQENRVCPRCLKNSLFGDEKVCPECNAIFANRAAKIRETDRESYNEKQKIMHKKMYDKRKEQGICTRCGKRKADEGHTTCSICRIKTTNKKREKCGKPDRRERYLKGLCYFCDNPVEEGYKVCEYHHKKNIEYANLPQAKEARELLKKSGILY